MRALQGIDGTTIALLLFITGFGVLNIYSVDPSYGQKQIIWAALACFIILISIVITSRSKNFFEINAPIFYILTILLLLGLFPFGKEISGAKAWYSFGGKFSVQPAEFAKIATGLMIANTLSLNDNMGRQNLNTFLKIALILAIPMVLILLQPDLGSVLVFSAFILALFREGLSPWVMVLPLILGGIFLTAVVWNPIWLAISIGYFILFVILLLINFTSFAGEGYELKHVFSGVTGALAFYFALIIIVGLTGKWIFNNQFHFENSTASSSFLFGSVGGIMSLILSIVIRRSDDHEAEFGRYGIGSISSKRPILPVLISFSVIFTLILLVATFSSFAFSKLQKHQKERVMVLFEGEEKYPRTAGYNLLYSKVAIGSGELSGRGWNAGPVTDGGFVPEQHTDYIFSTVGEEWGFLGTVFLVLLYTLLILRIYYLAEGQKTVFGRYFGNSVATILLMHFFMNVAMVMGLFPTVGIPLPFFSYGGSSLWAFSLLVFIFLKINYEDKQSLI